QITQQTPLEGLVDATPPDSREGRRIITLIEGGLSNRDALQTLFTSWANLPTLGGDAQAPAAELRTIGKVGLDALKYAAGTKPPPDWSSKSQAALDAAARPQGLVEFTIVPAMKKFVEGVSAR